MLYIRVDINNIIATGHVMRCLSIADSANDLGISTTFILADNNAKELIEHKGYKTIVLNSDWNDLDAEIDSIKGVIKEKQIDKILIDTYQVTENYLYEISKVAEVYFLDDLNKFDYPVQNIICYANYFKKFNYKNDISWKNTKISRQLFLGCDYVPLRKEFRDVTTKPISDMDSIMILSGGTDRFHIIENFLMRYSGSDFKKIIAICGMYYEEFDQLVSKYKDYPNISIYKSVDNLIDYMKSTDIVISAGGTTLYELCAVGTPTISYSFADNQLDNCNQFDEERLISYAGDVRYNDIYTNADIIIKKIYKDKRERLIRSKKMQSLVDGYGAQRIVETMIN